MSYTLFIPGRVKEQIAFLKKSDTQAFKKLETLLPELAEHPYTGTGKPEKLKYGLAGYYSRRITRNHRLAYSVNETGITVVVIEVAGHYEGK